MSIVSLPEFKVYLRNELPTVDDVDLQLALDTADRVVFDICHRGFAAAGSGSARTYVPEEDCLLGSDVLAIDDCTTVTSVVENGTTLTSGTHYLKEPVRLTDWSGAARPITQLRRLDGCWYRYRHTGTVVVTGTWGWATVPEPVKSAARVAAKDIAMHRDVNFGVVGAGDFGTVKARVAPLVYTALAPFVRHDRNGIA